MIQKVYCLYNNKSQHYNSPVYTLDEQTAIDSLKHWINETIVGEFIPMEYELFYMGTFDTTKGHHEFEEAPQHVLNISQLVDKPSSYDVSYKGKPLANLDNDEIDIVYEILEEFNAVEEEKELKVLGSKGK